jgi:hypothetical protein
MRYVLGNQVGMNVNGRGKRIHAKDCVKGVLRR